MPTARSDCPPGGVGVNSSLSTLRIIGLASPLGTARAYRCSPDRCDVQGGRGRAFNEADMSWPMGPDECASR